jgi:mannose-1-phosphate guanylyltransferase
MSVTSHTAPKTHCIVIAGDHGPEWAPTIRTGEPPAPILYARLGDSTTLLQRALKRAARIAPPSKVLVTALDEYRGYWEPALWCVRRQNIFICQNRAASLLAATAALLAIASSSPSNVVVILPARCHVSREAVLRSALERVISMLPKIPEGVATLGMVDIDEGIDEDYLVASYERAGPGLVIHGFARRPTTWIAQRLRQQGAMIASGIMVGYAGAFAAHISKHWPDLTLKLTQLVAAHSAGSEECAVPVVLQAGVPKHVLSSLRWNPPAFSQRAFCVRGCGWSGLKSARSVARLSSWLAGCAGVAANDVDRVGGRTDERSWEAGSI